MNPLLSSAINNVTVYQILAKRVMSPFGSISKVESVELLASLSPPKGNQGPKAPARLLPYPSNLFSLIKAYITRRKLFVLIHNLICLSFLERDTSF